MKHSAVIASLDQNLKLIPTQEERWSLQEYLLLGQEARDMRHVALAATGEVDHDAQNAL